MSRTPITSFRIPAEVKVAATSRANAEDKTLSRVVIELLAEYAVDDPATRVKKKDVARSREPQQP